MPEKLTSEQKEALRAFDDAMGGTLEESKKESDKESKPKKKGFMDKLKDTFEG